MARRRLAAAGLATVAALLLSACSGVPEAGPVTKVAPVSAPDAGGDDTRQQAHGPAAGEGPAQLVSDFILAMRAGDPEVMKQFLTPEYGPQWLATAPDSTTVFYDDGAPTPLGGKSPDTYRVKYKASGVIDESNSYSRISQLTPVDYTVTKQPNGEQLISNISQKGLFVVDVGLSDLRRPVHVYFPSHRSSNANIPRLVPDTVFLPVPSKQGSALGATDVLSQLLSGPTDWTSPGVYVTTEVGSPVTLIGVQPVPATGLTIVNLSGSAAQIKPSYLATLKAQIAYTLADLGTRGPIQLEAAGTHLGDEYSLVQA